MKRKIIFHYLILIICFWGFENAGIKAQPTKKQVKQVMESTSKTVSGLTEDKVAIEKEYLVKARHNIETYRKSDAVLVFVVAKGEPIKNAKIEINQVGWRTGKWTEETQAEFAEQFYTLAFGHPSVASLPGGDFLTGISGLKKVASSMRNTPQNLFTTCL